MHHHNYNKKPIISLLAFLAFLTSLTSLTLSQNITDANDFDLEDEEPLNWGQPAQPWLPQEIILGIDWRDEIQEIDILGIKEKSSTNQPKDTNQTKITPNQKDWENGNNTNNNYAKPRPSYNPDDIRIISWNIEWFPGGKPYAEKQEIKNQIKLVKKELENLNPDVLIAQEIRDWEAFWWLCSSIPRMRSVAVSCFPKEDTGEYWPQQIAIGSKLPVVAAWSESWKQGDVYKPRRGFTVAAIKIPRSPYILLVYSLHLKSNRVEEGNQKEDNYRTREESIKQLIAHANMVENSLFFEKVAGIVIGGDFNTNDDGKFEDNTIAMLKAAGFHHTWATVPENQRQTWAGNNRHVQNCFDHVFTKNIDPLKAYLVDVPQEASDHEAIELVIPRQALRKSMTELDKKREITRAKRKAEYENLIKAKNLEKQKRKKKENINNNNNNNNSNSNSNSYSNSPTNSVNTNAIVN